MRAGADEYEFAIRNCRVTFAYVDDVCGPARGGRRPEFGPPVASCSLRPFRAFYTVIESRVELPRDTQTLLNASHKSSDAAWEAGSSQASPAEAERHGSRSDKGMACCDISHARANGNRAYATAPARIKVHLSAFSWSSRLRGRGSQKS